MTDEDRQLVLAAATECDCDRIVITHGTSTMAETARFLDGKAEGKTIVLTGAMRPHSLFISYAAFSLEKKVIAAQTLPAGVYGVMNGLVFSASELKKNEKLGRFDV